MLSKLLLPVHDPKKAIIRTRAIAIIVAVIIVLAIVTPIMMTRYYLTPSSEQRVIEQVRATQAIELIGRPADLAFIAQAVTKAIVNSGAPEG